MTLAFIEDNLGKIMVVVGVFLLVGAVLSFSALLGTLLSGASLFCGVLLVFFGLCLQLGFFSGDLWNLGGAGTILISVSVVFFAFSVAAFQFMEVTKVLSIPEVFKGAILGWKLVPVTKPSFDWFIGIMMNLSIITLIAGIALKAFYSIRQ